VLRNIVFAAPSPSYDVMRFVRALSKLEGIRLLGVFGRTSKELASLCTAVALVDDATDVDALTLGVKLLQRRYGKAHRVVGINEVLMVQLAMVRERLEVPGTSVRTATLFREKALMKDALRAAKLPVAAHALLTSEKSARRFAEEVGFPLVLKPPAGVGARSTYRVRNGSELLAALRGMDVSATHPVLAEEMLRGTEHSFETITLGGVPRVTSFANYAPGCLEVLETPWIQWACLLPREVKTPAFEAAQTAGVKAIKALGLDDGMTHMEWFARTDGSLAIGEIAQRPPGPQLCQMTGLVNDVDIYRAWARAVVDGELDAPWQRKYAAGTAYLRGVGQGRVSAIRGVREAHELLSPWLVEAKLPAIGKLKNDSYEGDGYVVVRHESTAKVKALIKAAIETIKIHYA
jgi:biotin carboxylase